MKLFPFKTIQNFIAKTLLAKATLENKNLEQEKEITPIGVGKRVEKQTMAVTDNQTQQNETKIELAAERDTALIEPEFIKVEKNLIALGFFSASNKKTKHRTRKLVKSTSVINGKKTELTTEIVATEKYGLPGIAEQDTFFAIQEIWEQLSKKERKIINPVPFTYADILTIQGKNKSGFNYQQLVKQLMGIKSTGIEGELFITETQEYVKDVFNLIDRIVFTGRKMSDGSIADKNYIWFSQWFLENVANNYLLPIDYKAYKKLNNHIAKALAPLLQVWLYASREERKFEKLYSDICNHLGITCYSKFSDITRFFCPSLDELKKEGYLAKWELVQTADKKNYKIIFYHGSKFYQDRIKQTERKQKSLEPAKPKKQTPETIDITPEPQPAASSQAQGVGESKPTPTAEPEKTNILQSTSQTQPQIPQITALESTPLNDLPLTVANCKHRG